MAVTFEPRQFQALGLAQEPEILHILTRWASLKADGEIILSLFATLPRNRLYADFALKDRNEEELLDFGPAEPAARLVNGRFESPMLKIRYPLTEGGYANYQLTYLGTDQHANVWFRFPALHEQHGMPCLALVKLAA